MRDGYVQRKRRVVCLDEREELDIICYRGTVMMTVVTMDGALVGGRCDDRHVFDDHGIAVGEHLAAIARLQWHNHNAGVRA